MSDGERYLGFEDCWLPKRPKSVRSKSAGYYSADTAEGKESAKEDTRSGSKRAGAIVISTTDKARLARVVRGAPEVLVKVTTPAKLDKSGNVIVTNRRNEGIRVSGHMEYISRNGKLDLETSDGQIVTGKEAAAQLTAEWLMRHDEARLNGDATERTRITTNMVLSMPAAVNAQAVKDAVRVLAEDEFGGRHDYVMALHTDTDHPHVHLTVRTVGHDGTRLNLRKADLQHLRDQFAERLRQRGIDAEATPRHARGVTRKSERIAVKKVRDRGLRVRTDKAKQSDVSRDMRANGGRLPDYAWDVALFNRRNRVLSTYIKAAHVLAMSNDPDDRALALDTERFVQSLTDLRTERAQIADEVLQDRGEHLSEIQETILRRQQSKEDDKDKQSPEEPSKGPDKDRGGRGR